MSDEETKTERELPKYKSHKVVHALKIRDISLGHTHDDGTEYAVITPAEVGYEPFEVSKKYIEKHDPAVGGFYVVYADGYKSFSPAKAFEDGYNDIDEKDDWKINLSDDDLLSSLSDTAFKEAQTEGLNEFWAMAYFEFAMAADRLHAYQRRSYQCRCAGVELKCGDKCGDKPKDDEK